MHYFRIAVFACVCCVGILGCGGSQPEPEPTTPLTVEEWKALPANVRFGENSIERLKAKNPDLQSEAGWDKFMREVFIPERKKDNRNKPK